MRPVLALLICLTALGSGCAARQEQPAEQPAPTPVVVAATRCARPAVPVLPRLRGDLPLDHPVNVEAMLTRDTRQRRYVNGLNDALDCYDAQVAEGAGSD